MSEYRLCAAMASNTHALARPTLTATVVHDVPRQPATHVDPAMLLYVGVSRPQTYLVVLGDEGTVGRMRRGAMNGPPGAV